MSFYGFLEWLGFGEKRCAHCAAPYFTCELENPDSLVSLLLCPDCQKVLAPYCGSRCRACGIPAQESLCGECTDDLPPWQGIAFHGLYAGPLRDLVLRLKFDCELHISRLFAAFLLEATKCLPGPDLIISVPQHRRRLRERGFNQAHEISRALACAAGFRPGTGLLRRIRAGVPQEALGAGERRRNLAGAFAASPLVRGKSIWLLDDVLTTGSTCRAAASALVAAGARAVQVVFVARTPLGA